VVAASLEVSQHDLWSGRYVPLIEFAREHIGPRSRAWLDALVSDFLAAGGMDRAPRVLTHGDIAGVHLLLEGDGSSGALAGVIDFGDAALTDPALDFAGVLNDWSPAFLERVLAHYPLEVDPDARRRAAFYIAVVPIYSVHYGITRDDPAELAAGRRRLAARARASVVPPPVGQ
jgi:aminoglycoside phosphotransferase (APT) family kinase protein